MLELTKIRGVIAGGDSEETERVKELLGPEELARLGEAMAGDSALPPSAIAILLTADQEREERTGISTKRCQYCGYPMRGEHSCAPVRQPRSDISADIRARGKAHNLPPFYINMVEALDSKEEESTDVYTRFLSACERIPYYSPSLNMDQVDMQLMIITLFFLLLKGEQYVTDAWHKIPVQACSLECMLIIPSLSHLLHNIAGPPPTTVKSLQPLRGAATSGQAFTSCLPQPTPFSGNALDRISQTDQDAKRDFSAESCVHCGRAGR